MTFTCDGTVFTKVVLNYANAGEFFVTVTAANAYDVDTEATITAKIGGTTVLDETIKVCDNVTSGTCGATGDIVLDLSGFIPDDDNSKAMVATLIPMASIEIESSPNGTTEKCTQSLSNTSYQMARSATKTAGYLIGAVALIGLAAVVRRRKRSKSKNGADQRLYGGELA
mmetsp:Transcript_92/g.143  ORF Transcript_92/g.143 Transcript_92/m.143 type:complete len:170 (-) Transcript_92:141-650(-)